MKSEKEPRPRDVEGHENESQTPFRVMVVEDESRVSRLLEMTLVHHSPDMFEDGETAVEQLRQRHQDGESYNLVITDQGLAGTMTGMELAQTIKDGKLAQEVILLTGSAREIALKNTPEELRQKGVDHLVGKPFSPLALIQKVDDIKMLQQQPPLQP